MAEKGRTGTDAIKGKFKFSLSFFFDICVLPVSAKDREISSHAAFNESCDPENHDKL